jgi:hypothetical protein
MNHAQYESDVVPLSLRRVKWWQSGSRNNEIVALVERIGAHIGRQLERRGVLVGELGGDTVSAELRRGAIGIPWYVVIDCAGQ